MATRVCRDVVDRAIGFDRRLSHYITFDLRGARADEAKAAKTAAATKGTR